METENHGGQQGSRTYTHLILPERGDKTRNVHLGSVRKMNAEAALLKVGWMKGGCT
jgi:hypothetical protein